MAKPLNWMTATSLFCAIGICLCVSVFLTRAPSRLEARNKSPSILGRTFNKVTQCLLRNTHICLHTAFGGACWGVPVLPESFHLPSGWKLPRYALPKISLSPDPPSFCFLSPRFYSTQHLDSNSPQGKAQMGQFFFPPFPPSHLASLLPGVLIF